MQSQKIPSFKRYQDTRVVHPKRQDKSTTRSSHFGGKPKSHRMRHGQAIRGVLDDYGLTSENDFESMMQELHMENYYDYHAYNFCQILCMACRAASNKYKDTDEYVKTLCKDCHNCLSLHGNEMYVGLRGTRCSNCDGDDRDIIHESTYDEYFTNDCDYRDNYDYRDYYDYYGYYGYYAYYSDDYERDPESDSEPDSEPEFVLDFDLDSEFEYDYESKIAPQPASQTAS
jgi:hypothetical protein